MSASTAAIASRIGWSSALRFAGLEIVSRRTPSAGRSRSSSPAMNGREASAGGLLEDHEGVPLVHRLALLAEDLLDGAFVLGLDRHLHLHRLEDHDRVALLDRVADLALDLPHRARDVGLDVRHVLGPPGLSVRAGARPSGTINGVPDAAVIAIVTAYEEGDRLPDTLAALRRALPDAQVLVADDGSTDDTPRAAVAGGAELVRSERTIGKGGGRTLGAGKGFEPA